DAPALGMAFELLAEAQRPCLLVGHGVALAGATDELVRFARDMQIPVMTSPKGKGILPETDPLWIGVLGFGGHERAKKYLRSGAIDVLCVIGSSLNEFVTNAWSLPLSGAHRLLQIDIDPNIIGRNYSVDLAVTADAKSALAELLKLKNEARP